MPGAERVPDLPGVTLDSPEPAFIAALDGTIIFWNEGAAALFGVPSARALGRSCLSTLGGRTPRGGEACCRRRSVSDGSAGPMEICAPSCDGKGERSLIVHHGLLRDGAGQPCAVVHFVEDVCDRRERERIGARFLDLFEGTDAGAALTPREREVFRLVADGRTAAEVARLLGIEHGTARNHIQRILAKLGAHSRVEALTKVLAGAASKNGKLESWSPGKDYSSRISSSA